MLILKIHLFFKMSDCVNRKEGKSSEYNKSCISRVPTLRQYSNSNDNKPKKKCFIFKCCVQKEDSDYGYSKRKE
uniref:Uncharacterized protein n=1 Tax=Strongyloides papillosus TaxID=174720 RepID=A0A0N5C524_STREA